MEDFLESCAESCAENADKEKGNVIPFEQIAAKKCAVG